MSDLVKSKIYQLIDSIKDEATLTQVMEDVTFYASKGDIIDELTLDQLKNLDTAIEEVKSGQTIPWEDFKKEMDEWRKK